MKKRLIAILTSICILMTSVLVMFPEDVYAKEATTIHISSVLELKEFINNCRLNTYSKNLTVELDNDLNLGGVPFTPVPIFMGTFEGNNHTISGFNCANDGSNQGFFRYIEKGAIVRFLNVEGEVAPETGKCNIGGIVGTNSGTVSYCTFNGKVDGLINTGGICGRNLGTILACGVKGKVMGKQYTGGICGYNECNIGGCSNDAEVNTEVQTKSVDITKLSLIDLASLDTVSISDSDTVMDTGGIAGGSIGVLRDCTNNGVIGYQHYGYNVGGIAGRQSGFLTGCQNKGTVTGRKDVAGICGQMEPHMYLEDSESLVDELQALNDSISDAMNDLSGDANGMKGQLSSMAGNTSGASDVASKYESIIKDMYNDNNKDKDDSHAGETIQGIGNDIGNTIGGIDSETKDDILNGNINDGTISKVEDSINNNGGSTGSTIGNVADRVDKDLGNINDSTIGDISNGNINTGDIDNIKDTVSNSGAAEGVGNLIDKKKEEKEREEAEEAAKKQRQDEAIASAQKALADKVSNIGKALARINDTFANITGRLAQNMANVNAHFERVNRLMTRILTGDMTYYEDISQLDTENDVDGKVSYSVNKGLVTGDENVGGIAGEMAIEVEIDAQETIVNSNLAINGIVSKMYETRAVIRACSNEAPVSARKSNVGGIVGYNNIGIVFYCENYGDIQGESQNIGGIAGKSDNWVMGSYSMCNLDGEAYIGGIVGSGTQVTDSLSMVTIKDEHSACCGAIAGYLDVSKKNSVKKNYFISETLGGVDGISYAKKAEPISHDKLVEKEDIPEAFRNMIVTFVADGITAKILKIPYGEKIPEDKIPKVPDKEGYTGKWETFPSTGVVSSQVINAIYYPMQNSMATEEVQEDVGLPVVLVEGGFDGTAEISVTEFTGDYSSVSGKVIDAKTLNIESEEQGQEYTIRYLAPKRTTRAKIYLAEDDGTYTEVPVEVKGSYLAFTIPDENTSFVCVAIPKNPLPYILAGILLLIILFAIWKYIVTPIRSRRKAKKLENKEKKEKKENKEELESETSSRQ